MASIAPEQNQRPSANVPLLELRDIGKRFPGIVALHSISLTVGAGEIHALMGENGAGKSTLMKILAGEIQPSSGEIIVNGRSMPHLTPELATDSGIGLVHQELSLVPALSVTENIFLGRLPRTAYGTVDWRTAHERARAALQRLGVALNPHIEVRRLEVAEQQLVEIARILERDPRIVLFDEPTSALSEGEKKRLFQMIGRLREHGHAIIYISHHLSEIMEIADNITVLRDGNVAARLPVAEASESRIIDLMVGHRLAEQFPKIEVAPGKVALRVENLAAGRALKGISFEARYGEILGFYGLMGAGQAEIASALFGLRPIDGGQIHLDEKRLHHHDASDAIAAGMGLLSRDRRQSLVPMLTVSPNVSLAWMSQRGVFSPIERRREQSETARYVKDLRVRPSSLKHKLLNYSGGNQQKVVLARWMSSGARVLIFDEPTRGIDVGAKAEVFAIMTKLASEGAAILMISSEINELIGMADRVLVMRSGLISKELPRRELSQQSLLLSAN